LLTSLWGGALIEMSRVIVQNSIRAPATLRSRSVHQPLGRGVRKLRHGRHDPTPGRRSVIIAGECEFVSSSGAFFEGLLAIALEHQLRRPPDFDLRYHPARM
jgi:hypothetical protein